MTQRILVLDNVDLAGVHKHSHRTDIAFDVKNKLSVEDLKAILPNYQGLVVRSSTQVTPEVLEAGKNLKVVGRAGVGVDNINIEAATRQGVLVMNTPEGNVTSAAEHALALMFELARKVADANVSMKAGKWDKTSFTGVELNGRTLGLIGMGKVGRIVARVAKAIGMRVLVYDPYISAWLAEKSGVELVQDLGKLVSYSDVLSLHTPFTEKTKNMVNDELFAQMKDGVLIVNASRGGIIDEDALIRALDSGKVGAAALDVFAEEPLPADHVLRKHPKLILTPHLGASTIEAQLRVAVDIIDQMVEYLTTNKIANAVNLPALSPEHYRELHPYLVLTEIIGAAHRQLLKSQPHRISIELHGMPAEHDSYLTQSLLVGLLQGTCSTRVNLINAPTFAREHGLEWQVTKQAQGTDYRNLVRVKVSSADESLTIAGTVSESGVGRIVQVGNVRIEAEPYHYMIVMKNIDVPGIIGLVGTILGSAQVNIAEWRMGRFEKQAFSLISVDSKVDESILKTIAANPNISSVQLLELPVA